MSSSLPRHRLTPGPEAIGGEPNRVEDLLIAGAAAQVARERLADVSVSRVRVAVQQVVGGDEQAGRAKTALHSPGLNECLLQWVQPAACGQAFHGDDGTPVRLPGGDQARAYRNAVQVDRARAALTLLAGVLRAGQTHPLAEHVEQALARPDVVGLAHFAVDGRRHPHRPLIPFPARPAGSPARPRPAFAWPEWPGRPAGMLPSRARRRSAEPRPPPARRTRPLPRQATGRRTATGRVR